MKHREIALAIAPILNHLLLSPPFDTNEGLDFGWFCREHALATKLIYHTIGVDCDIVRGHVAAYVSGEKRLATAGSGAYHYWCSTNELVPCDLSMTFRHFSGIPQLNGPILGCETNGPFTIKYSDCAAAFPITLQGNGTAVYFAPTNALRITTRQYIDRPHLILTTKQSAATTLAAAAYISDIMNGGRHLFHGDTTQEDAVRLILQRYPDPSTYFLHY